MPKRVSFVVLALCATVLALLLRAFGHDGRRLVQRVPEEQGSNGAPTPPLRVEAAKPVAGSPPAASSAATPPSRKGADEASVLFQLHELAASDPSRSLALARDAVARFPGSPDAPEFEWNVVKALANMERYDEAREEAKRMLDRYPDSAFTADVDHHLIHHPPNPLPSP